MAYFDNLGNRYDEITIPNNLSYFETSNSAYYYYYIQTQNTNIVPYIIQQAIPTKTIKFKPPFSEHIAVKGLLTGISDDVQRYDSIEYDFVVDSSYYIRGNFVKIDSGLRESTFNTNEIFNVLSGKYNDYTLRIYNVLIHFNDGDYFANVPIITAKVLSTNETVNVAGYIFGGGTGTWYSKQWTLDNVITERDLDSTDNTSIGGGYGLGTMPHDNISIPNLPTIDITATGSTLYLLTAEEMRSFRNWLWTSDWQDNIKKIRTDTMQNIIGISLIDTSIDVSNKTIINVGNIQTSISASIANNFYELDCGTISLDEYYGSFADYEPFIATTLYLPKVGFVQIPADVCVNNTIKVVYHIEMSSGEGLCYVQLTSKRDGFSYIWNTYTCHITSNIVLSAQDHSQQLVALGNAIINTGINASNAIINPASSAQGLANTLSSCIDVATTKNPTSTKGNVGNMSAIMCYKKPYLLINRTNLTKPTSFQENNGYLINYTAKISEHTGFLKTKDFHAEFNAPYNHKVEIERIMNEGVFING